jgi:hypothetical protein
MKTKTTISKELRGLVYKLFRSFLIVLMICGNTPIFAQSPLFDRTKDILIAQFDSKPDADDIQTQAALGCILSHIDNKDVNYYAVAGAYGIQTGKFIDSRSLFAMAFGAENVKWTDANVDLVNSVTRIKDKVKPILLAGGKVWVQEAGQSNVTADWIAALLNDGVSPTIIKNNVMIVQHSQWNEDQTAASDFSYIKSKATYIAIDNGNNNSGSGANRGPDTPNYRSSVVGYMNEAKSSSNPNSNAKALWTEADKIIKASGFNDTRSTIPFGGVDFSDCVESWYILELGIKGSTIRNFWDNYVVNSSNKLGIENQNTNPKKTIQIYPNPASDKLFVNATNQEIQKIQLIDATGKVVYSDNKVEKEQSIDLSHLSSGLYIIQISTNEKIFTEKVVVK